MTNGEEALGGGAAKRDDSARGSLWRRGALRGVLRGVEEHADCSATFSSVRSACLSASEMWSESVKSRLWSLMQTILRDLRNSMWRSSPGSRTLRVSYRWLRVSMVAEW